MKNINSEPSIHYQENAKNKNEIFFREGVTKRLLEKYKTNISTYPMKGLDKRQEKKIFL